MRTPRNYLSYSQLSCYLYDPMEYYNRYILELQEPPNEAMVFGSITHKALANVKFNWLKALNKEGFTSDYYRVLTTALGQIELPPKREVKIVVEHKPINLLVIIDGLDGDTIIEYKTAGSHWTQDRVDTDLQLTFYPYVFWLKEKRMPKIILRSIHSGNGSVKSFKTRRTIDDFHELQQKIEHVHQCIKDGIWHK